MLFSILRYVLSAPEPGDGGAGGGGGSGGAGGEPPKPITEEDVVRIMNAGVFGAVKDVFKRQFPTAFSEAIAGAKLPELIADAVKKAAPPATPPAPGANDPPKADPRVAALEETVKTLKEQNEQEKTARVAAEKKARDDSARSQLRSELGKHVKPEDVDDVVDLLFDARKVVTYDESGRPLFSIRRPPAAGLPEEDVQMPLADGVASWAKTDRAKKYLPAPATSSGAPGRGAPSQRQLSRGADGMPVYTDEPKTDDERARRVTERTAALNKRLASEGRT